MSISNKKVFESFQKHAREQVQSEVKEFSDKALYSRFKAIEKELAEVLERKGGFAVVLEQHISFTRPKIQLFEAMSQILTRPSMLETIFSKQLDERFWVLLKKELRKSKQEQKTKTTLSQFYLENLSKNRELLGDLLKKAWKALDPLKEAHLNETSTRKIFGKLFQCLGEILKQKSKRDKSVLSDVKEFYMRSNKVFSFSGRCKELLGSNM